MRIDAQAQTVLDQMARAQALAPVQNDALDEVERIENVRRAYLASVALAGPPESIADVIDSVLPDSDTPVRIYLPEPVRGKTPLLLWFHGGGFVSGDLETHDRPLRALANRLKFPIIAVAWRLAPEHPFPAGLEDAMTALRWAVSDRFLIEADPQRIAVGGDSAGGTIAAVTAQQSIGLKGLSIAYQVLLYPNTDLSASADTYASWREHDGRVLVRADQERNWKLYAGAASLAHPAISPLLNPNLTGLPRALVITAEADPQRDEAELYARRLCDAGVSVEQIRYPGMIHGFFQMGGVIEAARHVIDTIGKRARAVLRQ